MQKMGRICLLLLLAFIFLTIAVSAKEQIILQVTAWGDHWSITDRIAAFEQAYPHIKIDWQPVPNTGTIVQKIPIMTATGTAPDVYRIPDANLGNFWNQGLSLPIEKLLPTGHTRYFTPGILQDFSWNGVLQGLPQTVSLTMLYYNNDLFQRYGIAEPRDAGITEIRAAAKKLTIIEGNEYRQWGFEQDGGLHVEYWSYTMYGGDHTSPDAKVSTYSSPETIQSLREWVQMVLDGSTINSSWDKTKFSQGLCGMLAGHVGYLSRLFEAHGYTLQNLPFDVRIGRVPKGTTRGQTYATSAWTIHPHTKYPEEAALFIAWITSPESQRHFTKAGRGFPTHPAMITPELFADWPKDSIPILAAAISEVKLLPIYYSPYYGDWNSVRNNSKLVGPMRNGSMPLESTAAELDRILTPILQGAK